MKIVVNDIAASTGGAMSILRDFYSCVCENDHENQWIFLLGEKYFEETENVKILTLPEIKKSRLKKLRFDLFTGRRYIGKLQPDVVFSLQNTITFGLKVPQVVYIHQALPFQTTKRFSFFRTSERALAVVQHFIGQVIKLSARRSNCVIVQTKWLQDAVCKSCHLPPKKVVQIMPDVQNIALRADDNSVQNHQFFYPTGSGLYKNTNAVMQASALLTQKGLPHTVTMTLPAEKSQGNVHCIGKIPYEQVLQRYQTSTLLFPSYIETFGYPLAEARQVGTIILAADTPFARELLAGYKNGYFFDPFDPKALAELMEKVITGQITLVPSPCAQPSQTGSWCQVVNLIISYGRSL